MSLELFETHSFRYNPNQLVRENNNILTNIALRTKSNTILSSVVISMNGAQFIACFVRGSKLAHCLFMASLFMAILLISLPSIGVEINLNNKKSTKALDEQLAKFVNNLSYTFSGNNDGDREHWVENVHKHFTASYPGYGVMVIHAGQDQITAPENSYEHFHLEYRKTFGTEGFEVYVIRKGSNTVITNKGDGGYINWRFSGHKKRDGKLVVF